jgi:hypothetical protein
MYKNKVLYIMSADEQQLLRENEYAEAIRYMDNARETLKKAGKEGRYYNDVKYVKTACGTAYNAVLIAMDAYFQLCGVKKGRKRKSIEYYQENLGRLDKKLLRTLNVAYETLHLCGYYDGTNSVAVVKEGFEEAYRIIETIKPAQANG